MPLSSLRALRMPELGVRALAVPVLGVAVLGVPVLRVPVDPSVDQAREWLQRELSRAEYADDRSLLQRALDWVNELIADLTSRGMGGLPGWALPVVVAGVAALVALVVIVKVRREPTAEGLGQHGAVIEDLRLDAEGYRARARRAFDAGDSDAAAADWFRAITAAASERAITDASPGRTAHEVSVALAEVFPGESAELAQAANHFDAVRYGAAHIDAGTARFIADLDQRLASARPFLDRAAAP